MRNGGEFFITCDDAGFWSAITCVFRSTGKVRRRRPAVIIASNPTEMFVAIAVRWLAAPRARLEYRDREAPVPASDSQPIVVVDTGPCPLPHVQHVEHVEHVEPVEHVEHVVPRKVQVEMDAGPRSGSSPWVEVVCMDADALDMSRVIAHSTPGVRFHESSSLDRDRDVSLALTPEGVAAAIARGLPIVTTVAAAGSFVDEGMAVIALDDDRASLIAAMNRMASVRPAVRRIMGRRAAAAIAVPA